MPKTFYIALKKSNVHQRPLAVSFQRRVPTDDSISRSACNLAWKLSPPEGVLCFTTTPLYSFRLPINKKHIGVKAKTPV